MLFISQSVARTALPKLGANAEVTVIGSVEHAKSFCSSREFFTRR